LSETPAFDGILFSYLYRSGASMSQLLGNAIPLDRRAAQSWLSWIRGHGSDQQIRETWTWMKETQLLDQQATVDVATSLWERKSFHLARDIWAEWFSTTGDKVSPPSLIANSQFKDKPVGGPFDWTLDPSSTVIITRQNGLDIRFSGSENVAFANVRQGVVVGPGRYRFSAEVESHDITPDEGPFFNIFDPANPGGSNAQTAPIKGTVPRSWLTVEFLVPAVTQALVIEVDRRPSGRIDNKISGALHIYQMSLDALPKR
jgi:hypothetical protein